MKSAVLSKARSAGARSIIASPLSGLLLAHLNNDPENFLALVVFCQVCHMKDDGYLHVSNSWRTRWEPLPQITPEIRAEMERLRAERKKMREEGKKR